MPETDLHKKKVSFHLKEETKCSVCETTHSKEELLSGGGRLIAGKLTEELRRLFEPSKKWGKIYPLAYQIQVCPRCLFASYSKDFENLTEEEIKIFQKTMNHRQKVIKVLFGNLDFTQDRDLVLGVASFILAVDCYHLRNGDVAPTPKKAVSAIRAAWLLEDLFQEAPYRPYDKVRDFYYKEAIHSYSRTLKLMETGGEPIDSAAYMLGPDIDQNWAFDGIIYLNAYLTRKYVDQLATSESQKIEMLSISKRYLSKLYGSGKSSKSKPSAIIDMSKDLYDALGEEISKLEGKED